MRSESLLALSNSAGEEPHQAGLARDPLRSAAGVRQRETAAELQAAHEACNVVRRTPFDFFANKDGSHEAARRSLIPSNDV